MADNLGIMLTELPEAESINDNDLMYIVQENNSEKVKVATLRDAVHKIQVPEVISTGDKACYVKRAIPTAGALAEGQKIVGATLAWNQLVPTASRNFTNGLADTRSFNLIFRMRTSPYTAAFSKSNVPIGIFATIFNGFDTQGSGVTLKHNGAQNDMTLWDSNTQQLISGHKYIISLNVINNSTGTVGGVVTEDLQLIDLTQLFGSTIADTIYQMEQTTAGSGVAFFRKYFPKDYYSYESGKLESVNVSAHKAYDSNATEVSSITLDSSKEFRGLYELVNGELRADGDIYEADGTVTRKYGIVDLGTLTWEYYGVYAETQNLFCSDSLKTLIGVTTANDVHTICEGYLSVTDNEANTMPDKSMRLRRTDGRIYINDNSGGTSGPSFKTYVSGIYLVYPLATPTTESATPYTNPQLVDADGTEEFVDYKVSQGTRDVAIPVGHESSFYDYTDGTITIPNLPFADGTYALSVTMNNGTPTFSWVSDT